MPLDMLDRLILVRHAEYLPRHLCRRVSGRPLRHELPVLWHAARHRRAQ
jgi:hypothetical protein